jgi:hypothetical protein
MTLHRSILPGFAAVSLTALALTACQKAEQAKTPAPPASGAKVTKADFPDWPGGTMPEVPKGTVEPGAVDALKAMSQYLMSLKTIGIDTDGTLDVVTAEGQRVQLDGKTSYKIRRPGFAIHFISDMKNRDFFYDGKQFTIYSPALKYYATAAAPATNREALDVMYNKYGIKLPLEDLFRWNDTGNERLDQLKAAADLGPSMQNGVATTHYAFREPEVDWEVWIKDGDQPLPVKMAIVDRTDPARPAFTTRLKWTVNPSFSNSDFTFTPGKDDKKIQLAQFEGK